MFTISSPRSNNYFENHCQGPMKRCIESDSENKKEDGQIFIFEKK